MSPKQKGSKMNVRFSNMISSAEDKDPANGLPFFLSSTGIAGVVDTSPIDSPIDSLQICLQGSISVRIPQRQRLSQCGVGAESSYKKHNQKTIMLVQNVPCGESANASPDHCNTAISFHLGIANLSGGHSRGSQALPPTMYYQKISSSPTSTQAETTEVRSSYHISISAIRDDRIISTNSQPIRLYDNSPHHLPSYQPATIADHLSSQTSTFRRNILTKAGTFTASIPHEPPPMVFSAEQDFTITSIPLYLTAETLAAFSELDASITWRLRTTTIASLTPMTSCPSRMPVQNTPSNMTSKSSLGLKHNVTMKLNKWDEDGKKYMTLQNLAITLPKAALLVPTTNTEHISRRYSVQVEITVRGKDVGKANVCTETPLQIGWQDCGDADVPEYEEWEGRIAEAKPEELGLEERRIPPPPFEGRSVQH